VTTVTDRRARSADTDRVGTVAEVTRQENCMKANVGSIDRALRIILGLALIAMTLMGTIGAWGWIGVVPLATGALGNCPLYSVLGFSSCPVKTRT
jgi:Protein of unknown function (DUF2892)